MEAYTNKLNQYTMRLKVDNNEYNLMLKFISDLRTPIKKELDIWKIRAFDEPNHKAKIIGTKWRVESFFNSTQNYEKEL